jgi:hypothetical protein
MLWSRCIIFEANPSVLKQMLLFINTKERSKTFYLLLRILQVKGIIRNHPWLNFPNHAVHFLLKNSRATYRQQTIFLNAKWSMAYWNSSKLTCCPLSRSIY